MDGSHLNEWHTTFPLELHATELSIARKRSTLASWDDNHRSPSASAPADGAICAVLWSAETKAYRVDPGRTADRIYLVYRSTPRSRGSAPQSAPAQLQQLVSALSM
ncbi:hypothetical protein NUW54_g6168 [Trametes sanguinea]|uniref:Uncharacterized protein n=1 Tax=Trametes sanguinea TaxID=158606 RepID=A0ACC1PUP2_9APHY|nr:hypothetical protein NUW54_g6168 [Trametes sanguinea]